MAQSTRVGFIGLGLMGKPMARNVLKAGFPLWVYNRTPGKAEDLVSEGATTASTPADLARQVDVVLSCVSGPADVEQVYLGPEGVMSGVRDGSILVDMSTIDPGTHRKIAEAAAKKGASYLDAPVSGGTTGARDGTLSIMVGGDAATFEQAKPVLEAMGQRLYHVGPVGAGAAVKLVNNMMSAINAIGVIEGMVLGTKAGVDPAVLYEIVSNSSGASRALGQAQATMRGDFEPGFMIDLMHKDVNLALDLGKALRVRLLGASIAGQVLQEAQGLGLGDKATNAQIIPLERIAGVEVRKR